jgi:hypothetical protein
MTPIRRSAAIPSANQALPAVVPGAGDVPGDASGTVDFLLRGVVSDAAAWREHVLTRAEDVDWPSYDDVWALSEHEVELLLVAGSAAEALHELHDALAALGVEVPVQAKLYESSVLGDLLVWETPGSAPTSIAA